MKFALFLFFIALSLSRPTQALENHLESAQNALTLLSNQAMAIAKYAELGKDRTACHEVAFLNSQASNFGLHMQIFEGIQKTAPSRRVGQTQEDQFQTRIALLKYFCGFDLNPTQIRLARELNLVAPENIYAFKMQAIELSLQAKDLQPSTISSH